MEIENRKLKPCPFCGGKAHFIATSSGSQFDIRKISFQVECIKCRVSIPRYYKLELHLAESGEIEITVDERNDAVEDWNKRIKENL